MWVSGYIPDAGGYTYQEYDYWNDSYYTHTETDRAEYWGNSFLLGMGIQTGFSLRFNPYTSLDINGLLKFPFSTVDMKPDNRGYYRGYYGNNVVSSSLPENKSFWPFIGGIELGLTLWFPYRSRGQR
jgi:hypothetical protein